MRCPGPQLEQEFLQLPLFQCITKKSTGVASPFRKQVTKCPYSYPNELKENHLLCGLFFF